MQNKSWMRKDKWIISCLAADTNKKSITDSFYQRSSQWVLSRMITQKVKT